MWYVIRIFVLLIYKLELMNMEKSKKVVVITGCSSGFGEEAVMAFADKGYCVWGTLRDSQGRNASKKAA